MLFADATLVLWLCRQFRLVMERLALSRLIISRGEARHSIGFRKEK
jgi:hypothetical protein